VRFHAGENGTGKTTFIRMLAGLLKSDEQAAAEAEHDYETAHRFSVPQLNVSYKPQKISPKFQGTVRELLHKKIRDSYIHPQFVSDVMRPMSMDPIMENGVQTLSGGELQRVAIVLCLGTPADIYLVSPPCIVTDASRCRKYIVFKLISHGMRVSSCMCITLLLLPLLAFQSAGGRALRVPGFGAAYRRLEGDQALHHARQEDRLRGGARLHHGHLPGRQVRAAGNSQLFCGLGATLSMSFCVLDLSRCHCFNTRSPVCNRVIVYDGRPGVETTAHTPQVGH
jgi:ABC-type transport system involved in cytochrome c biogenesis ATPase subunit